MKALKDKLDTLCIFRDFLKDPVISALCRFLDTPTSPAYAGFVATLYEANGGDLSAYVKELCDNSSNIYVKTLGRGKTVPDHMYSALLSELETLQEVADLTKENLCSLFTYQGFLPDFAGSKLHLKDHYLHRTNNIEKYGYGIYARNHMFCEIGRDLGQNLLYPI